MGGRVLTMDEVLWFYAPGDFHDMAGMGVNAVRIPVPCWAFHDDVVVNRDFPRTVLRLLDRAKRAGLKAILVLVGEAEEDVLGLGMSMEECREAPPPDDDDNNNKCDSAGSRCAFAR
jgi:aryl-phospho-beta-D-glucosidase BglC (GH1 family)